MGARDMTEQPLPGCQYVSLTPTGFRDPDGDVPVVYETYFDVRRLHTNYQHVLDLNGTYADLLAGHDGAGGDAFVFPRGTGITFGIRQDEAEWWLTAADGLNTSPLWQLRSSDPAISDGTWFHDVRATGKQVSLTGTIVADSHAAVTRAADRLAGALTVQPRTGWLLWRLEDGTERRLPVALAAPSKASNVGRNGLEVQVEVKGVDIGTTGRGAYIEGTQDFDFIHQTAGGTDSVTVDGGVPTPPRVEFRGKQAAGSTWKVEGTGYLLTTTVALTADQALVVDCARRTVSRWTYNPDTGSLSAPASGYGLVTLGGGQWPVIGPGPEQITVNWTGGVALW